MAWTAKQKALAAQACKAIGLADEHRRLILCQVPAALYDEQGQPAEQPSTRSKRLTNADFEAFMAIIEHQAGGQVRLPKQTYEPGHFQAKADDQLQRMRHLAHRLADALENAGLLEPGREGVRLWTRKYVREDGPGTIEALDYVGLHKLINGLRAYARRHDVEPAAA